MGALCLRPFLPVGLKNPAVRGRDPPVDLLFEELGRDFGGV